MLRALKPFMDLGDLEKSIPIGSNPGHEYYIEEKYSVSLKKYPL
jgi:hypothetical protein